MICLNLIKDEVIFRAPDIPDALLFFLDNAFVPLIFGKQPTIANVLKKIFVFYIMTSERREQRVVPGMEVIMQFEIKIDSAYTEPKILILTDSVTEEVNGIVKKLSEDVPQIISGSREEKVEVLEQEEIIRIYASSGKVFAVTKKGEYTLRLRLYEIEERLNSQSFVRISNSEIVNLKQVESFDLSFTGTICVKLSDGTTTYVSRRYVSKIKKILGM